MERSGGAGSATSINVNPPPVAVGGNICCKFRLVRDGRREADAPGAGCDDRQPRQAERQQIAALDAGQRMNLIDDDGAEIAEQVRSILLADEQGQAFRRREQNVGRCFALPLAPVLRGVAGAGLDADGQGHLRHRILKVSRNIGR